MMKVTQKNKIDLSDKASVIFPAPKQEFRLGNLSIPKWIFFSLLSVLLYGLVGLVAKFASDDVPPLMVQVLSTFGMVPILIILALSINLKAVNGKYKLGVFFSILIGIITTVAAIAQYAAFNIGGPASVVVPVVSLSSLVTVVLAQYVFKDKLSLYQLIGIGLSIVALVLFNLNENGFTSPTLGPWWKTFLSTWMFFALLSMFAAGTAQLFIKVATNHISADLITFIVISVLIILATVLVFTRSLSWDISWGNVIVCLSVGLIGSAAFYTQSLAYSSGVASLVAPLISLFPVVTVILAVPFLGEKLTMLIVIAVIIASVAGVALSIKKAPKKKEV